MKISALFTLKALGFLLFLILFIRIGFFFHITVDHLTLLSAFFLYIFILSMFFTFSNLSEQSRTKCYFALSIFILFFFTNIFLSFLFGLTYDTSWDGQGYNQTAIIAFENGWNPIYEPSIQLHQKLVSQVFSEGYPSALWEIQSSIFALMNKINAGKIINLYISIVGSVLTYTFFRKLNFSILLSGVLTILLIAHPVYLVQVITFMQDGFGYQLILISVVSLLLYVLDYKAIWSLALFFISTLLMVIIKYSLVPIACGLIVIGLWIVLNNIMNKRYKITLHVKTVLYASFLACLILAYLPYIRNIYAFGYPFYPTNIPDLIGSVKFTNIPHNLPADNKAVLLFYGIFSESQPLDSGDPHSETNKAKLKIPFTFSHKEIIESGGNFNNRVGGLGPLFSGTVVISFLTLLFATFAAKNRSERYTVYSILFLMFIIIIFSLLTPAPNLHRYVTYLYFLPFVIITPLIYEKNQFRYAGYATIVLLICNTLLNLYAVTNYNLDMQTQVHQELKELRSSDKTYKVSAQNFYSNYNLLAENNVQFVITDQLICDKQKYYLVSSSKTTAYCEL